MNSPTRRRAPRAAFTLVESLVAVTLVGTTVAMALGTFVFCLRSMYKDAQRLATNASLRAFTAHVSKETIDSSEFHILAGYHKLDGNIDLAADVAQQAQADYGTEATYGDCLVLVTRTAIDTESNIRQFRIYYRVPENASGTRTPANPNNTGAIRYYESQDWGASGTTSSLTTLLNAVNLNGNPLLTGSRQLVGTARGRPIATADAHWCPLATPPYSEDKRCNHTADFYPIFSSESSTATPVNDGVSINAEIINGTSAANQLSSSSFNYTISPRR